MTQRGHGGDTGLPSDRHAAELDLRHAAQGVRDVLGYGVVAVSLLRDTGEYEFVSVLGPQDAVDYLLGTHLGAKQMARQVAAAEVVGRVHYVARGTMPAPGPRWAADIPVTDDPEVWHPGDELFVLLVDGEGRVRGHVALDGPPEGRVPTTDQRRRLEAYVDRMVPAVLHADAHRRIDDQVRIAAQARDVVRRAITRLDESELFEACAPELAECLRADEIWFRTEGGARFLTHPTDSVVLVPDDLADRLGAMARESWRDQQAVVVEEERVLTPGRGDVATDVLAFLASVGLASLLLVPLGAGSECLGLVVGVRRTGAAEWTDLEIVAAQDLGRDLGSALQTARFFERERGHAAYKQQLIATIAHELKNPLTAVRGNLELLGDVLPADGEERLLAGRIERATGRLTVLVGNLLTLSEVDDTVRGGRDRDVALADLVLESVEVVALPARQRGIELVTDVDPAVGVRGIPSDLEHLVVNLVSNAVKYSEPGGRVTVSLAAEARQAVLRVTDVGIGIAPDEVGRVFGEFFRSADPAARARPGTGLGLAIAARVAARHDAAVDVTSELGRGTTFTVRFPLAEPGSAAGRDIPR